MKKLTLCLLILLAFAANGIAQKVSLEIRKQLAQQMVKDEHISATCLRNEGVANAIGVDLLYLNRDKQPEYYVYGKSCGEVGARRPASWIYLLEGKKYRAIFGGDEGEQADIKVLKTRTNGFLDIQSTIYSGGAYTAKYKYNGKIYD